MPCELRRRVLMLCNESPLCPGGGLGVHVRYLADELSQVVDLTVLGVDHTNQEGGLWVSGPNVPTRAEQCTDRSTWKAGPGVWRLLLAWNRSYHHPKSSDGVFQDLITYDNVALTILQVLRNETFDIIHLHDTYLYPIVRWLREISPNAAVICTAHLSFSLCHPQVSGMQEWKWWHEQEVLAYFNSDAVIAVSGWYKGRLVKRFGVNPQQITTIHNGVPFDELRRLRAACRVDRSHKRDGHLLVGFLGRLVPTKGVASVVEAAKALPDVDFLCVSSCTPTLELVHPLQTAMEDLHANRDGFTLIGDVGFEEKWRHLLAVDVAIMPSFHEPFGITALEWLLMQISLIVSRQGGLVEFCTDTNSVLIDTDPMPETLIAAIRGWRRDESKIAAGLETARQMSWGRCGAKTNEVYEQCL